MKVSKLATDNTRPSADGSQILTTLTIEGTVQSPFCDTIPGDDGTINSVSVFHKDVETPTLVIPTTVNKSSQDSFLRPFPFSATFSQVIENFELFSDNNVFRIVAADPSGISGYSEFSVLVEGMPPQVALGHALEVTLFPDNPSVITATLFTKDDPYDGKKFPPIPPATLNETASGSLVYQNNDKTFTIVLSPGEGLGFAMVTNIGAGVYNELFKMESEGLLKPNTYLGKNVWLAQDYQFNNWKDWTFAVTGQAIGTTGPGIFDSYLMQVNGPEHILKNIAYVETQNGRRFVKKAFDGNYYVSTNLPSGQTTPSILHFAPADKLRTYVLNRIEFDVGFVKGLGAGGWNLIEGTAKLLWVLTKESLRISPLGFVYVMTRGDHFKSEKSYILSTAGLIQQVADIFLAFDQSQLQAVIGWLTGQNDASAISKPYVVLFQYCAEIIEKLFIAYKNAPPEKQGYVMGRLTFEVLLLLLPYADLTEISKVGLLTKLANLPFFKTGAGAPAAETIAALLKALEEAKGLSGYEDLLSLYNFMRRSADNKTAWETLEEMKDLPGMPFNIKGEPWRRLVEKVNDEMWAKLGSGEYDLNKMPSVKAWKDEFDGLKLGESPSTDQDIHIHHSVEFRFQKSEYLDITNSKDVADKTTPGFVIRRAQHTGGEDRLAGDLLKALSPLKGTGKKLAMTTKIKEVYLSQSPPLTDLWVGTRKWLISKGIDVPPN